MSPKRILVPLDGSLRTEIALPTAARLAIAHGAEVLLVHIVLEPVPSALLTAAEDVELARTLASKLESNARKYLDRVRARLARELRDAGGVRTLVVRHANERQSLLDIAEREHVDLIVLSAHGAACDSGRSFGSVAAHLIHHSAVPLLVLQDLAEQALSPTPTLDGQAVSPALRASYAAELG